MIKILRAYETLTHYAEKWLSPVLDLAIRIYMAKIFFVSGKQKFDTYMNEGWEAVVLFFSDYHPVPGLDPHWAALGGVSGELILPALLALGLFTRFSAAGLIIMTLVIQFAVPEDYGVANPQHYMWMLLLAVPLIKGGGLISVDHVASKFIHQAKRQDNQETGALPEMVEKEA